MLLSTVAVARMTLREMTLTNVPIVWDISARLAVLLAASSAAVAASTARTSASASGIVISIAWPIWGWFLFLLETAGAGSQVTKVFTIVAFWKDAGPFPYAS